MVLDLRGWLMQPGMLEAAENSGVPLRLSSKYWAEFLGRPYQPAETFPGYSYIGFLERPRPYEFYWELWTLGSNRLLLSGDPEYVRRAAPTFALSGTSGFEIDAPLAQRGFGNGPEKYGILADSQSRRVFWQRSFERYWLFYLLWGRLSFDPKTPDKLWMEEFQRRFGAGAADVADAYRYASRALNEIVAAHMENPNMYVWPEISAGKRVDEYAKVRPSDWRLIASPAESVENRLKGIASAKQTPRQTATLLDALAERTERALARAGEHLAGGAHTEWLGTEPDLRVLAALARYHARKMLAAEAVAEFGETHSRAAIERARRDIAQAAVIWERLVKETDGVYPPAMAYGPRRYRPLEGQAVHRSGRSRTGGPSASRRTAERQAGAA